MKRPWTTAVVINVAHLPKGVGARWHEGYIELSFTLTREQQMWALGKALDACRLWPDPIGLAELRAEDDALDAELDAEKVAAGGQPVSLVPAQGDGAGKLGDQHLAQAGHSPYGGDAA